MTIYSDGLWPYLPTSLVSFAELKWYIDERAEKTWKRNYINKMPIPEYITNDLYHTAIAIAGYFFTKKYAGEVGISPMVVALVTSVTLPEVGRMAIGGHFVFMGVKGAIAASKTRDVKSFALFAAMAACGYFCNTRRYNSLADDLRGRFNKLMNRLF